MNFLSARNTPTVKWNKIIIEVIEAETQAVNDKYRHYVLLEYPIGEANKAFANEIRQNEILATQEAADAALAELVATL